MSFATPRTWQVGDEVTAALLNGISTQISQLQAFLTPSAWVNITVNSPYVANGSPQVMILGGVAYLYAGITNSGITTAYTTYNAVMTIPSGYRPALSRYIPCGNDGHGGVLRIESTGAVDLYTGPGVSAFYRMDGISYPVGN